MSDHIDRAIPLKAVIWAFPAVFLIHDGGLPVLRSLRSRLMVSTREMSAAVVALAHTVGQTFGRRPRG